MWLRISYTRYKEVGSSRRELRVVALTILNPCSFDPGELWESESYTPNRKMTSLSTKFSSGLKS